MKRLLAIVILLASSASARAQGLPFTDAKLLCTLPWDADWVTSVSFVGNDKVVAGNKAGDMLMWKLPADIDAKLPPNPVSRLTGHTNEVTRLVITPDQKTLISASLDHSIKLWDMEAGSPISRAVKVVLNERARFEAESRKKKPPTAVEVMVALQPPTSELAPGHKDWVLGLSMTPDGKTLVSGADRVVGKGPKKEKEGEIIVWDLPNRKEVKRIHLKGWPWGLAVSPDGKTICAAERVPLVFDSGSRSALGLWDIDKGTNKVDMSKEMKERMAAAAYSKDGKWLAVLRGGESGGLSGKITLLDPTTGKKIRETNPGHLDGGTDLAFHPDGIHIFSAGRDTTVKIWRLEDGKHVRDLGQGRGGQFKDWICAIAISPDGRMLAAADMAGAVQIWALSK